LVHMFNSVHPSPVHSRSLHDALPILDTASIAGLGTAGTLEATTIGNGDYVASASSLGDLVLSGGGSTISAAFVMANAFAGSSTYGYSLVDGLVVNGVSIVPTGDPNQTVYVGGLMIVLNEVTQSASGIAVTALHITTLDGSVDLALASASAAIP